MRRGFLLLIGLIPAFAAAACGSATVTASQQGDTYRGADGWTIQVPKGLQLGRFHSTGRITTDGIRVTNFPPDLEAASQGAPPMGWLRSFPANGVAVQIWFSEGGPVWAPPLRDSAFPLSAASFRRIRPYVGGSEPRPWYCSCYGNGVSFSAAVWLGPHASSAEQHAAWAVVRSLRFPALREGTIWHGYYVLGRASQYPMGSVTTVAPSSLPGSRSFPGGFSSARKGFYLIHAPRAFYVITKVFQAQPPPSFTVFTCTVEFDPKTVQFYCPDIALRWDRAGQPVGAHAGSSDWALGLRVATVAQDGHVLFSPFFGALLPVVLKGSPWG